MQIRCPVCDYVREVNLEKVPPTAEFATCPKCRHRFRFRALDLDEVEHPSTPPKPAPGHTDIWDAVDSLHDRWQEQDRQGGNGEQPPVDSRQPRSREGVAIPWENPRHLGYGKSLVFTTLWAFFQPTSFFAALSRKPALLPALLYYVILGVVQYLFSGAWMHVVMRSSFLRDSFIEARGEEIFNRLLDSSFAVAFDPATLISVPFVLVIQAFFTAGILHIFIRLAARNVSDFALVFKVVSYSAAGFVLTALPVVGVFLGPLWYFVLLVIGCRNAFRFTWSTTMIVMVPLLGLLLFGAALQASQIMSM